IVQVKDMTLNEALNTLAIATYGRSAYQIALDDTQATGGAITSLSGTNTWAGPVILAGPTSIGANGNQFYQDGRTPAVLSFLGVISDQVPGANFQVTKVGGGDVVFAGANTYGGVTLIQQGVLIAENTMALGDPVNGTFVNPTDPTNFPAALELESSIAGEPLFLMDDGVPFNGHFTGALRNISNNNTYSGPITLQTNSTIAVDSGSQLTISNAIGDGVGNVFTLTKELTGTLVLAFANTYHGTTFVHEGALRVADGGALGSTTNGTIVTNGAQIQMQGGVT